MPEYNKNHAVIAEEISTSVMPANKMELLRDVTLKAGFNIHGAIYANNLHAEGNGTVDGAVFAKREAILSPPSGEDDRMVFRQGINSSVAIMVNISDLNESSPVRDCSYTPLIIKGDVCSGKVKLDKALVFGNIHCEEAYIKESIILGSPFVSRKLQIEDSVMVSFNAGSVWAIGRNSLWIPYGIARGEIKFIEDGSIRYIALCASENGCNEARIACSSYLDGNCKYSNVQVNQDDIIKVKLANDQFCKILTVAPRLINAAQIEDIIGDISEFIINGILFEHFDDASKKQVLKSFTQDHEILIDRLTGSALPQGT